MSQPQYIHGYDQREQDRLIAQAAFWRDLIRDGLDLRPGQRLLEIGCGAGAVLGEIAAAAPGALLAGIDIEPRQIERAQQHLSTVIGSDARAEQRIPELRVGDAARLPWPDATFDQVFLMWVLEHLTDSRPVLRDAHRVLKPGGSITITETDYNFVIHPENPDFTELMIAWRQLFVSRGSPLIARALGPALLDAGFTPVSNRVWGFHHFVQPGSNQLARTTNYIADFMEPECRLMAQTQGRDEGTLRRGITALRSLASQPAGSMTGSIYRAIGIRP